MPIRLSIVSLLLLGLLATAGEPDLVKAINLDKLNSPADEDDPCPADGLTLLYATTRSGPHDIHIARRGAANQPWQAGKPYPGLASKDADERSPFVFRFTLYFASNA